MSRLRFDPARRALMIGGALSLGAGIAGARTVRRLNVFAAASLKPALDEIATRWDAMPVALSYGGSGAIARQVAVGAPADVVILAATDWMDWLRGQTVLEGATRSVAANRLVLAAPPGTGAVALSAPAVLDRLGSGRIGLGDPMSVPAGRYGQQALETLGLWTPLSDRLLLAEDVRAVLAYVARGSVPLGLVYRSDAEGLVVDIAAEIPAGAHAPISYPAALVQGHVPQAAAFLDHLSGAADVFARHGFSA